MLSVSCKELALRESWQSRQALTERVYAAPTSSSLPYSTEQRKSPCIPKRMQGLSLCLLQDDLAVFIGIHHKGAAGSQRAVDQSLGGGVFHRLADHAAQIARTKLAALTLLHQCLERCRGVAVSDALGLHAGLVLVQHQGRDALQRLLAQRLEGDHFIHAAKELRPQELGQRLAGLFLAELFLALVEAKPTGALVAVTLRFETEF